MSVYNYCETLFKQKVYNLPHSGCCQCSGTSSWRSGRCFRTLHLCSCWADSRHLGTDAEWFRCSGLVQTPAQIEWDHIPSGSLLAYIPWRDVRIARSWETLRGTVYIHIMMRFTEQYSLEKNSISNSSRTTWPLIVESSVFKKNDILHQPSRWLIHYLPSHLLGDWWNVFFFLNTNKSTKWSRVTFDLEHLIPKFWEIGIGFFF